MIGCDILEEIKDTERKVFFRNRKKLLWLIFGAVAAALIIALVLFFCMRGASDEAYKIIYEAINKAEAKKTFMLQIDTAAQIDVGNMVQKTETNGYITSIEDLDTTHFYINTASNTSGNSDSDFDVTVSIYSDGEKVWDNSGGNKVEVDMTCKEFDEIVEGYSLYRFDKKNVQDIVFLPQDVEGYDTCGEMTVMLTKPEDRVLSSYSKKLSEITGEKVENDDLKVLAAMVSYNIFDGMVQSQTYSFTVEYTTASQATVRYGVSSQLAYSESGNLLDEYDDFAVLTEEE